MPPADLAILHPSGGAAPSRQGLDPAGGGGLAVRGVLKAVQDLVVELFTADGSAAPALGPRGCGLIPALRAARSELDVAAAFAMHAPTAVDRLRRAEPAGMADDERVRAATLESARLAGGRVVLRVAVVTAAGARAAVDLPAPIGGRAAWPTTATTT